MGYKLEAKTFNVPKTTLRRRLTTQDSFKAIKQEIASHIIDMETRFFSLTPKDLRRLVFQVAERNKIKYAFNCKKKLVGWKWVRGFLKCNPHILFGSPESTSLARAQAFNEPNIDAYFKALSNNLDQ
nr:unnamed protein product [Callosobruchus analis]